MLSTSTDISKWPLGKIATWIAKQMGAAKIGEGANYQHLSGDALKRSRYYRLPSGLELRISDHADRRMTGMKSHIDIVIATASKYDDIEISIFSGAVSETFELGSRMEGRDVYADEHYFDGDGAALSAGLIARIKEIAA